MCHLEDDELCTWTLHFRWFSFLALSTFLFTFPDNTIFIRKNLVDILPLDVLRWPALHYIVRIFFFISNKYLFPSKFLYLVLASFFKYHFLYWFISSFLPYFILLYCVFFTFPHLLLILNYHYIYCCISFLFVIDCIHSLLSISVFHLLYIWMRCTSVHFSKSKWHFCCTFSQSTLSFHHCSSTSCNMISIIR